MASVLLVVLVFMLMGAFSRWKHNEQWGYGPAIVSSLVFSLTAIAILSKEHLTNQLWPGLVIFAVPMPIALYFRNRIVLFGVFTYLAALMVALVAAIVLFGI